MKALVVTKNDVENSLFPAYLHNKIKCFDLDFFFNKIAKVFQKLKPKIGLLSPACLNLYY